MKRKLLSLVLLFVFLNNVNAQLPGDLDTSFGVNGKVNTNFGQADFMAQSQFIQTDGKILIAGRVDDIGFGYLVRLNSDGTLDTSFNTTGRVINEVFESFIKVKLQTDGKIIVLGLKNNDVALARYNQNGTLDSTFDTDGMIFSNTQININQNSIDFDLQTDGKIVVLTEYFNGDNDYRVIRYLNSGVLDNTFGNNGIISTDIGNYEISKSIIVQSDNKILVSGLTNNFFTSTSNEFIARYTESGSFDTTFNTTGKRVYFLPNSTNFIMSNLVLDTNGKIIFVAQGFENSTSKVYMVRVNPDSSLDNTFDSDGIAVANIPNNSTISRDKLKIQPDGKYLYFTQLYGTNSSSWFDILGVRFNENGTLDTTFDTDGLLLLSYTSFSDYFADFSFIGNSILITGNIQESMIQNKIAITKLNFNGTFDTNFNLSGVLFFNFQYPANDFIKFSEIQSDGRIVVAGTSFFSQNIFDILTRYNTDGTLDTSFGTNGIVNVGSGINCLTIDPNGKILVSIGQYASAIIRLTSNGAFDNTFDSDGYVTIPSNLSTTKNIKTLSNGKIILAGIEYNTINSVYSGNYMLARLNSNGGLDATFGTNGISNLGSTNAELEELLKVEIQTDGKIVTTGTINNGTDLDIAVFRYNSNGSFDTSFNGNGQVSFESSGYDSPTGLAIQSDGKILISANLNDIPKLIRLTATGSNDLTFDTDGIVDVNPANFEVINALKLTSNQKILIAGEVLNGMDYNFTIFRYNTDGSLDTSFGNLGNVQTDFNLKYDGANTMVLTNDNRLVVSGTSGNPNNSLDFALAKYYLEPNLSTNTSGIEKSSLFYPNPVQNSLNFKSNVKSVEIITLQGKKIETTLENNCINVSSLSQGIYLIKLTLEDDTVVNSKLIKD